MYLKNLEFKQREKAKANDNLTTNQGPLESKTTNQSNFKALPVQKQKKPSPPKGELKLRSKSADSKFTMESQAKQDYKAGFTSVKPEKVKMIYIPGLGILFRQLSNQQSITALRLVFLMICFDFA